MICWILWNRVSFVWIEIYLLPRTLAHGLQRQTKGFNELESLQNFPLSEKFLEDEPLPGNMENASMKWDNDLNDAMYYSYHISSNFWIDLCGVYVHYPRIYLANPLFEHFSRIKIRYPSKEQYALSLTYSFKI